MSIASEIERINGNISAAYQSLENAGFQVPEQKDSNHLQDAILSAQSQTEKALLFEKAKALLSTTYFPDDSKEALTTAFAEMLSNNGIDLQASFNDDIYAGLPEGFVYIQTQAGCVIRPVRHGYDEDSGSLSDNLVDTRCPIALYHSDDARSDGAFTSMTVSEIDDSAVVIRATLSNIVTARVELTVNLLEEFENLPSGGLTEAYSSVATFKTRNGDTVLTVPCSIILGKF